MLLKTVMHNLGSTSEVHDREGCWCDDGIGWFAILWSYGRTHVDKRINKFEDHEVAFDPFTDGEVFNVDVSGVGGGFLCVAHCCAAIVVFEEDCSCLLWHMEIPEYASDE